VSVNIFYLGQFITSYIHIELLYIRGKPLPTLV